METISGSVTAPPVKPPEQSLAVLVDGITQYREKRLAEKITPWPRSNLYASSIPVCTRQGVYEFLAWDQKKLHDTRLQARFEEGDRQEQWVINELANMSGALGFKIVEQQVPLAKDMTDRYKISGKIDGKIAFRGKKIPFEVKSMHPMFYDGVNTVDDLIADSFLARYYRQMQVYMLGHNEAECLLILTDCLGHWKFIVIPIDMAACEAILKTAEEINLFVSENAAKQTTAENWILPDRIAYDDDVCGRCAFAHICLPNVINAARLQFSGDKELAAAVTRHEEIADAASEYKKLHEKLAEHFKAKRASLIIVGDPPNEFIVTGKPRKAQTRLPSNDSAPPELLKAQKELLEKYGKTGEPGWDWKVKPMGTTESNTSEESK